MSGIGIGAAQQGRSLARPDVVDGARHHVYAPQSVAPSSGEFADATLASLQFDTMAL
jgi:hypothetical protein